MPYGPLGDHRRGRILRLFPQRQPSPVGRTLFHLLHRDAARPFAVAGARWQALSHNRPQSPEPLATANFITQQDLGGDFSDYINDAELRNAPDTRAWRRGGAVPVLLVTGAVFQGVDKEPSQRQLYPIAELGKPKGEATRAPEFMRLLVAPEQPRIQGEALDFRDEIMAQIFDKGDPQPKRTLTFDIEVTDEGSTRGPPVFQRRSFTNWRRIGKMTFDNAVVSYNGDFVIHFSHPTWRNDRNDPSTTARVNGRKVR